MSSKLKELIRDVRACKTRTEERALVQKECASIRSAFKKGKEHYRNRCMLKLLYIAMLGYPTEFAQMEVVKLIAQPQYAGKRIGYLTMSIVLGERSEVLTLAENHIKKDLENCNPFIQSIALDTVANIAGHDMCCDVLHEILPLLNSTNFYLKKKACLAGLRVVRKAPEHAETLLEQFPNPFTERDHSALLTSLALINECLTSSNVEAASQFMDAFRQHIPAATRMLKQLTLASRTTDHDVAGISDPFLQVRLLQFLRITGTGCHAASSSMNDCLAQVITNTDGSKNVGNAVLYEATKAINAIYADDNLLALSSNALGKFLTTSRDNNIRFVALSSLLNIVGKNSDIVRIHQLTIVDCLKDHDYSICRLALRLIIALIDNSNVRIIVPDLLNYLGACSDEAKSEVTGQLCDVVLNKAPTDAWRIEMVLRLLETGKHHIRDEFALDVIAFISQTSDDVKEIAVKELWRSICVPFEASQQARHSFLICALWCVGEFSDVLVSLGNNVSSILDVLGNVTKVSQDRQIKQYGLTALMKTASRYPEGKAKAIDVFETYATNLDCELQQRAQEYIMLLNEYPEFARGAFERMPAIEAIDEDELTGLHKINVTVVESAEEPIKSPPAQPKSEVFDDIFCSAPSATVSQVTHLDDLFGDTSNPNTSSVVTNSTNSHAAAGMSVDDLFGVPGTCTQQYRY
eukprot:Tbor_TRINITY_DN5043_c0_g1::TRINITY_DN5043_c0_g1_i1::g.14338::m.14338/K12391/AP1G1; AP-1 complex subunit gamma-1